MNIGPAHSVGPFQVRRIDYPPGLRQATHSHQGASITLLLSGHIRESTRAAEETGSALSVVAKPPGVEHADEIGPGGARTLQVAFDARHSPELDDGFQLTRWRWLHDGRAASPLLALARLLSSGAAISSELEDRVLDVFPALDPDVWPARSTPPDWLTRVKEALDDELEAGISVRELARRVSAHPVSVSRAFRRHYGMTVSEYRRRERVRRAAGRISASPLPLTDVAYGAGFADHPHLCREFRRITGLTPSEFRQLIRVS